MEPLLLIYRLDLGAPDGTSVQLRRMFAEISRPVVHFFQVPTDSGRTNFSPSWLQKIHFADPPWRFNRGARFYRTWWHRLISPASLRCRYKKISQPGWSRGTTAYVVVLDEEGAVFAGRVLDALRPRAYVLHLMDLFCDGGLNPAQHPNLARLIRGAAHVRCICPALAREVAKVRRDPCEIAALLSAREVHTDPVSSASKTALMGGSLYASAPRKLGFFRDCFFPAWQQFLPSCPDANLAYAGVDHAAFPLEAKALIRPLGNLGDAEYDQQLRTARIAILPISHHRDEVFRFSVVSRLVDYFVAGLPVIADRSPGTGTGEFLAQFEGNGALLVETKAEALAALKRLFLDDEFHRAQSCAALRLAAKFASPAALRTQLRQVLDRLGPEARSLRPPSPPSTA